MNECKIKEVIWIGSSRRNMQEFPLPVRRVFDVALYAASLGEKPAEARPLKGFCGAGVLELVEDYQGGMYRAV